MNTRYLSVVFLILVLFISMSQAEIPRILNYQGKVTDTGGVPVADGDYSMTFTIFDAETAGTSLWSSGALTVSVSGGIFSVLLGESPQPTLNLAFDGDYWLEVDIAGDVQSPRTRLGSVGYAYMASGLVPGTEVVGSVFSGSLSVIKGENTAVTSSTTYGLYGKASSSNGVGVCGTNSVTGGTGVYGLAHTCGVRGISTSTSATAYGVYGEAESEFGYAVYGKNAFNEHYGFIGSDLYAVYGVNDAGPSGYIGGSSIGVHGSGSNVPLAIGVYGSTGSTSGRGVYGYASSAAGVTSGVSGNSASTDGRGVYGWADAASGETCGVYGESSSTDGRGVFGNATATSGETYGVYGQSNATAGRGVYGRAFATTGTTYGICGLNASTDGRGVYGYSYATSGVTYGVYGQSSSTSGLGLFGHTTASTGENYGVCGMSNSTEGGGVYGITTSSSGTTYGVLGSSNSTDGFGVYYTGGLAGTGTKSCVVKTSQGPTLMYCQESPENWFEDFGEGQLLNGQCHIELDPIFLETVTIDVSNPMLVFLQPFSRNCSVLVVERGETGFDVYHPSDSDAEGSFGYRVVAKRKGFEDKRLDYCKAAETDPYLYPELREKGIRELESERTGMKRQHFR